ncbi:MAG: MFS transporter [Methanomassiliicoccales archaeon]
MNSAGAAGRRMVLYSILSSRLTYAVNWYTTASPALGLIAVAYHQPLAYDGLIASIFLLSVGVFQLPAGALSAHFGSKQISIAGLLILSLFNIFTPASPNYVILLFFRFIAGLGAALFFAPAIGVLSAFFSREERTGVIGLYNASFQLGAGATLFFWPFIDTKFGWQTGVIAGGALCLATAIVMLYSVDMRHATEQQTRRINLSAMTQVLRSGTVWMVSLGFVGVWGAVTAASQYLEQFGSSVLKLSPLLAGLLASLILFSGIAGGVLTGALEKRTANMRRLLIATVVAFALSMLLFEISNIVSVALAAILTGALFTSGVSLTYALPAKLSSVSIENIPLAVSLVNSIQVLGGFWVPTLFGYMQANFGYPVTWASMAAISLAFLPFYVIMKI